MNNNFVKTSKRNTDLNNTAKIKGSKHNRKNNRKVKRNWE